MLVSLSCGEAKRISCKQKVWLLSEHEKQGHGKGDPRSPSRRTRVLSLPHGHNCRLFFLDDHVFPAQCSLSRLQRQGSWYGDITCLYRRVGPRSSRMEILVSRKLRSPSAVAHTFASCGQLSRNAHASCFRDITA